MTENHHSAKWDSELNVQRERDELLPKCLVSLVTGATWISWSSPVSLIARGHNKIACWSSITVVVTVLIGSHNKTSQENTWCYSCWGEMNITCYLGICTTSQPLWITSILKFQLSITFGDYTNSIFVSTCHLIMNSLLTKARCKKGGEKHHYEMNLPTSQKVFSNYMGCLWDFKFALQPGDII